MFNAERTSFEFDPDEQAQAMVRLIFAGFPRRGTPYSLLRYLARQQIKLPVRLRSGPERGQLHWHRPNNPARKESCSSAGATSQTSCSADCWFNGDSICPMTRKRPESVVLSEHEWWLPDLAGTLDRPRTGLNLWCDIGWVRGRKLPGLRDRLILCADEAEMDRLNRLRQTRRRWSDSPDPKELTTPTDNCQGNCKGTYCG